MKHYNLPEGEYWMYLRKSRADLDAEARGEGETLAKHRKALFRLAKEYKINITEVFSEIVSGESLIHRPEALKMLQLMEERKPKGVLVMDMDRLGRGDKVDQGMIERAFKSNRTLIVTPSDIYDINDEAGEFNVEVRSFLARMELKQITKRLQGGRIRSVEEGNYIGTHPPYGYIIHKEGKSRTLLPHPEQSLVVKMIFDWYTHDDPEQRLGSSKIASELNRLGYLTYTGRKWTNDSVLNIIKNEVYIGRLQWGKKEQKKSTEPGKKRDIRTRPREEWVDVEGKHEPLISPKEFKKAQDILRRKYHVPYQLVHGVTNPLAGLIRCGKCGSSMVLRPYTKQKPHLICYSKDCSNKSSRFEFVEDRVLDGLKSWLREYKAEWGKRKRPEKTVNNSLEVKQAALKNLEREMTDLQIQKGRLHDFLERGIYDENTYLERSQTLADRMDTVKVAIEETKQDIALEEKRHQAQKDIIPKVENVLELYSNTDDPAQKNNLLKSVLESASYEKEKYQREDDFTLVLYPKLPQ